MFVDKRKRRDPSRDEAKAQEKQKSVSLRSRVQLDGYLRPKNPITKDIAEKEGEDLYWPEKQCRRGHHYWRITKNGKCLACEHLRVTRKKLMPGTSGDSWFRSEKKRIDNCDSKETCISISNPTVNDLSPELRKLIGVCASE